jgi:hypothetical protein
VTKETRLPKGVRLGAEGGADGLFVLAASTSSLAEAASQLPADPPCERLFVHPEAAREEGLLARLRPRKQIPLSVRASALLARGYKSIEAAEIDSLEWVWGNPR